MAKSKAKDIAPQRAARQKKNAKPAPAPKQKPQAAPEKKRAEGTIEVGVAARLIMVGERRVQQLVSQGWIKKPYTVVGVVHGYLRFLEDAQKNASRGKEDSAVKTERARKLKLENDETERLTLRTEDAIAALDAIVGPMKSELAGVAPRVTDDIALRRRIEDGIDAVLGELAQRFDKACADLRSGRDALAAGAEDDAERVGEEQPHISAVGG